MSNGPVIAVIPAAGLSRRMGQPKQLLPWGETTMLGHVLHNLQQSRVDGLLVVTGHAAADVIVEARKAGVRTAPNPAYRSGGMLSSIQAGVRALPAGCAAALVMLADQPFVTAKTINALLVAYRAGCGSLVAPEYDGRRGNPVVIDRCHFAELLALPPGSAPRELIEKNEQALCLVPVADEGILIDIDRPEIYERLRPEGTTRDRGRGTAEATGDRGRGTGDGLTQSDDGPQTPDPRPQMWQQSGTGDETN